jgi:hypothetical protein
VTEARAALILGLFLGGIVAGDVVQRATDPGVRANPYASLERIDEPGQSAEVAAALLKNEPKTLARLMDNATLTALREALMSPMGAPMADIRQVRFVGATSSNAGKVLAGYIVTGKDMSGSDAIIGFVIGLQNGKIVGVN